MGEGAVHGLSFSELGYLLAAATEGSTSVSLWDLRNESIYASLEIGGAVESVQFDYTGQFLAVGGTGSVSVHQFVKSAKSFVEVLQRAASVKAVAWGSEAKSLVTLSDAGALNIFGPASA